MSSCWTFHIFSIYLSKSVKDSSSLSLLLHLHSVFMPVFSRLTFILCCRFFFAHHRSSTYNQIWYRQFCCRCRPVFLALLFLSHLCEPFTLCINVSEHVVHWSSMHFWCAFRLKFKPQMFCPHIFLSILCCGNLNIWSVLRTFYETLLSDSILESNFHQQNSMRTHTA